MNTWAKFALSWELGLDTKICQYIFIKYFNWKNLYMWEL